VCVCVTALHYAAAAEQFDVCMSLLDAGMCDDVCKCVCACTCACVCERGRVCVCVCVTALHYAAAAEQFDVCMSLLDAGVRVCVCMCVCECERVYVCLRV